MAGPTSDTVTVAGKPEQCLDQFARSRTHAISSCASVIADSLLERNLSAESQKPSSFAVNQTIANKKFYCLSTCFLKCKGMQIK